MANDVVDLDQATTPDEVLAALRNDLGEDGFQHALDQDHTATYLARGAKLLVTFETLDHTLNITEDGLPIGLDFAEDKNWSLLHFSARRDTWFRAGAVYEFIDTLIDDMFFEEFDQVMFYGAGSGAYAACAYSIAAPGATVLALTPQATLAPDRAGWDMRFPEAKRLNFKDRYGYAPDMLEGAQRAHILFDPYRPLDHMHASLFASSNVTKLKCRHLDGMIELALREMDLLHQLIEMASSGELNDLGFYRLMRKRRDHMRYLRTVLHALGKRNQPGRVALLCQYVLKHKGEKSAFRKPLQTAIEALSSRGPLPDWLQTSDAS